MVNKKLVDYIQEQAKRGFDVQSIRGYLLRYGYSPADVDEAIRHISSPEIRHIIHFSPATLIGIAAIFVVMIVAVVVAFKFLPSKAPATLLDMNLESVKTTANSGEEITFISELDNLGSASRYDVNLRYELINTKTNEILTFKEETRAIETKGSKQVTIEIPPNAAIGEYVLRAIATYNGQRAVATLPVKIGEKASKEEEVIEKPDGTVVEEKPEEIVEEPAEEAPQPEEEAAGTSAINTFETLEKVGQIANQNKKEAERLCNGLELQTSRDLCFNKIAEVLGDRAYCSRINDVNRTMGICLSNIAKITGNSAVCEQITRDSMKDNCYMGFVTGGKNDFSVCDKVTNQYLRQSCESLKQLSKLNLTDVAFYESLINQSLIQLT